MNRKRIFGLIILALMMVLPANAVLKEKDLASTLDILRGELIAYHDDLQKQSEMMQGAQTRIFSQMRDISMRSSQNSLMLYSQKQDYIFDLTYACHEATEMYLQFKEEAMPFRNYIDKNKNEIARYDSLVNSLSKMTTRDLSERAQIDRNVCLTLAVNIRRTLQDNSAQMEQYIEIYNRTDQRLRNLNDYANKRYAEIQSSIFVNGGDSYTTILKAFSINFQQMESSVQGKYRVPKARVRSQWRASIVFMLFAMIIVYGCLAALLNILFFRYVLPKRFQTTEFVAKKKFIVMATSVITLAIILGIIRIIFTDEYFLIMASSLLVEYAWLLGVILLSLLARLKGNQIGSAFRIYAPLIVIGFIVISFRIVLIPNDLVNLIFPPILLICTVWQWLAVGRHNDNIPKSDVYYTYFSLLVFILSVGLSWSGYTLFSVQALIWWIMQLTCILTITFVAGWLKEWGRRRRMDRKPINKAWFYEFCTDVVMPVLGVFSFIIAIYWAADVFNMSDTTWKIFTTPYIDTDNFRASIYGICQVVILFFLFGYINRSLKEMLALHFEKSDHSTAASRNVLARNITQIIVWGLWAIIVLGLLHVSTAWIAVIGAGLSTGVGFASKDIIENIYYGISLMAGRVKIGDLIECDGVRGTVSSISYTSTLLSIADGSIIAFQNSQLFTKNYKNLTKNHGYELDSIEIGVAYGANINNVRAMLIEAVSKKPFLKKDKPVSVVLSSFGDSSVNLKVLAWVPVATYVVSDGEIRECIYDTLNANNIEIPFPQVDVHSRS